MEYLSKLMSLCVEYGPVASAVVAGLVGLVAAIAPLTSTKLDDKLLGALTKLQGALAWLVVKVTPKAAGKALAAEVAKQAAK
jgi:hypothetical protein